MFDLFERVVSMIKRVMFTKKIDSFNINVLILYLVEVFEERSPQVAAGLRLYKTHASKDI